MNKHTRSVSLIDGHTEEITDAEIKKALECCKVEFENCEKCPYGEIDCLTEKGESLVMRDALDLINRKNAEIEMLQKMQQLIKSEAIKEFWKRLMDEVGITPVDDFDYAYVIRSEEIDNLVKEMTEVSE